MKNSSVGGAALGFKTFAGVAVIAAAAIGAGAFALPPTAYEAKVSPALKRELAEARAVGAPARSVLVMMKDFPDLAAADAMATREEKGAFVYKALTETAARTQAPLLAMLQSRGMKAHSYYIANLISIDGVTPELVAEIAARADVARVYGNPTLNARLPKRNFQPDARRIFSQAAQGNIARTGAERAWKEFGARGQGIVIAGNDTGVQWDHPALRAHYRGVNADGTVTHERNWHDSVRAPFSGSPNTCGRDIKVPCDDSGHGTHTMGTMVGDDGAANVIGMAPDAKWIACRNMDSGVGKPESYIECFEFFLAPYAQGSNPFTDGEPKLAPHVINNSWGCPLEEGCEGTEMTRVLDALMKSGIYVVASAGNDGGACETIGAQPATLSGRMFAVGALTDGRDSIAYFSSRGPSALTGEVGPDITAPGMNIRSCVPGNGYEGGWNGTSMAGPHVAGAVALLWSARPELIGKFAETTAILHASAKPLTSTQACNGVAGTQIPNNTFGYGALDIYKAISTSAVVSRR